MVLNYQNGPTLRCLYPEPPHPLEVPSCEEFGVIGSVPGLIGTLQSTEVFKIIIGLDGILSGKIFMIDTLNFNTTISTFEKNSELSAITDLENMKIIVFATKIQSKKYLLMSLVKCL